MGLDFSDKHSFVGWHRNIEYYIFSATLCIGHEINRCITAKSQLVVPELRKILRLVVAMREQLSIRCRTRADIENFRAGRQQSGLFCDPAVAIAKVECKQIARRKYSLQYGPYHRWNSNKPQPYSSGGTSVTIAFS